MTDKNTAAATSWKNPSAATMTKCGVLPLPDDFVPTPQEQSLLDIYETVRQYEKQAKILREESARQKLQASKAAFEQRTAPHKRKRQPKQGVNEEGGGGDSEPEETVETTENTYTVDIEEDQQPSGHKPAAQPNKPAAEDQPDDALAGLTVRKKVKKAAAPSLIANLKAAATPPHEFSSTLDLTNGQVRFPEDDEASSVWTPPTAVDHPSQGALEMVLDDFDLVKADAGTAPNTLAIKFKAPADSKRFSVNIMLADDNSDSILFHFNPRQRERGGTLVINDKSEGTWGQAINIPLSEVPIMFGEDSCTLVIQINKEGFDCLIRTNHGASLEHCARLEHRMELPDGPTPLLVQMPSSDDYGNPEHWTVFRVWWGTCKSLESDDLEKVHGVNIFQAEHPRKLIVRNLPKIKTASEVDYRRAELERAFRKYGGDHGVIVSAKPDQSYAFVEMDTDRQADLALTEMGHVYQLGRARWTRGEAMKEQRANKEKAAAAGH